MLRSESSREARYLYLYAGPSEVPGNISGYATTTTDPRTDAVKVLQEMRIENVQHAGKYWQGTPLCVLP